MRKDSVFSAVLWRNIGKGSAPGYRSSGSGVLGGNGLEGSLWSISASGANSIFLAFYTQSLYPSGTYYRGHGLQLRCLSE
ncbi:hypothetical protein [uncultured Rikenella sp.]|uniref:hypothetical protein n=1 Tax=uncultured Rikenella sp. TaxID=368003 RepID=UPI0025DA2A26|nr:hypothetical protein [uncultured Rikenella sp.]